jgi:hypothetical protein
MRSWVCYAIAVVLGVLGCLVTPESCRAARRLWRIRHEGVRVAAEITRIEEERSSAADDETPNAPLRIVEHATVRYSVGGKPYEGRYGLPGPVRTHRPGDKLVLLLLADDPSHAFPEFSLPGSWMTAFLMPPLLFLGAAVMAGVGSLFRRVV